MSDGYVKLFRSITRSSVWDLSSETRIVWITILTAAGRDGILESSVGGLANLARVSRAEVEEALDVL